MFEPEFSGNCLNWDFWDLKDFWDRGYKSCDLNITTVSPVGIHQKFSITSIAFVEPIFWVHAGLCG